MNYKDKFTEQIDIKEAIAEIVFGFEYENEEGRPAEWECHSLADAILESVVSTLRPDLIEGVKEDAPFQISNYEPNPEKPGHLRFTGNKTFGEVGQFAKTHLKKLGLDTYEWLSIGDPLESNHDQPIPPFRNLVFSAGYGSNEGEVVEVCYENKNSSRQSILRIKLFEGLQTAFEIAHQLRKAIIE